MDWWISCWWGRKEIMLSCKRQLYQCKQQYLGGNVPENHQALRGGTPSTTMCPVAEFLSELYLTIAMRLWEWPPVMFNLWFPLIACWEDGWFEAPGSPEICGPDESILSSEEIWNIWSYLESLVCWEMLCHGKDGFCLHWLLLQRLVNQVKTSYIKYFINEMNNV